MARSVTAAGDDCIVPFQIGDSAVRGRCVRLGSAIDRILAAHAFPSAVSELLGEAAALVAMMGSSLKFDGKLILQAQGDGPLSMLVADYSAGGRLRATASSPVGIGPDRRGLGALLGLGHMALTIDQGPDMERYQGITPIEGGSLEAAAAAYFGRSEQIPTAVRLAVGRVARPGETDAWRAGGIMIQLMPGEGGDRARGEAALQSHEDLDLWDRAAAFLATAQADELLDPSLGAETLLYRLYHEDGVRVYPSLPVRAQCSCTSEKIAAVLERYDEAALAGMIENGAIRVTCEFCRTNYFFDANGATLGP